jgi:hypothetical protein
MMASHGAALEMAHQARLIGKANWGMRFDLPVEQIIKTQLPSLGKQRALANVIADAALWAHFNGDDATAIDRIKDELYQADAIAEMPMLICFLVSTGVEAMCVSNVQLLATDLTIEGAKFPSNKATVRPASRQQVKDLITQLLDDEKELTQLRLAMESERVYELEQLAKKHSINFRAAMTVFEPFIQAAATARLPEVKLQAASSPIGNSLNRLLVTVKRVIFAKRGAAIGLAVRMYWNDNGHYPTKLDELVPEYLSKVPVDPMTIPQAPIVYMVTENGKRPVLVGAGENGKVEFTSTNLPLKTNYDWRAVRRNEVDDQYVDLSLWHAPKSVTQPAPSDGL